MGNRIVCQKGKDGMWKVPHGVVEEKEISTIDIPSDSIIPHTYSREGL